jgi:hypothetical protein
MRHIVFEQPDHAGYPTLSFAPNVKFPDTFATVAQIYKYLLKIASRNLIWCKWLNAIAIEVIEIP